MVPAPFEAFQTKVIRPPRCRKIARRHDAISGGGDLPLIRFHRPDVRLAVEDNLLDPGVELDLAPKVEAVGDVIDVTQDLGLRAVALRPKPFLLQLVGEGIRVFQALDVAAAARIAVPVPCAANPAAGLEAADFEPERAQTMDRVEAADAGAHDDRVKPLRFQTAQRHFGSPSIS